MKDPRFRSNKGAVRRDLALLLSVVLLSTLPFLNRAIHLDENTYLAIARNVPRHFWFPQDFNGLWFGIPLLNFSGHTHPVGLSYYLAFLMKVSGSGAEWVLRLGFIIFPLGYVMAGYFLARRFTKAPLLTAILMMATPAVLVFSPTLMPDLPMTTFWLLAAVSFFSGLDERKFWKVTLAGMLLIGATLISYQGIFMSLPLAVYAWCRGERRRKIFLNLALPVLFLALYWFAGYLHYGFFAARRSGEYLALSHIFGLTYFRQKVLGMLSTVGATTVFCVPVIWMFWRSFRWRESALVGLLTVAACFFVPREYSPLEFAEFIIFVVTGLSLLWLIMRSLIRSLRSAYSGEISSAGDLFLALWAAGVVGYTVLLSEFTAARYIAAMVPPLAICFVQRMEVLFESRIEMQRNFLRMTIVVTWIVALAVAYADYQFVGSYREFSERFSRRYMAAKGTVWVGTEAGLRYYMERGGARTLVNAHGPVLAGVLPGPAWGEAHFGRPALDDLLVRPAKFLRYDLSPDLELSALIDSKVLTSTLPIRTYEPSAHAGLHGTNVGLLPFALSSASWDQINVYQYNVFASSFENVRRDATPRGEVQEVFMTIDAERHAVIALPPSARLTYTVTVPPGTALTGDFGVDDTFQAGERCKPELFTSVRETNDSREIACAEAVIDPHGAALRESAHSVKFLCSLSGFGGQKVDILFQTGGNAQGDTGCPGPGVWNLQWIHEPWARESRSSDPDVQERQIP